MTHMVFISPMLILPVIDFGILAVGALTLKSFRKAHSKGATPALLAASERMVKLHKDLALVSIPILWAPGALFLLGLVLGALGVFPDVLFSVVSSVIIIGAAKVMGGLQNDVETLSVESEALRQERDRVVGVWQNHAFPDWLTIRVRGTMAGGRRDEP